MITYFNSNINTFGLMSFINKSKPHIQSLDYLRGIMAFSIMINHYFAWGYGESETVGYLQRIGFYGVTIFYVLSGLTLFYVYDNRLARNGKSILTFYLKRVFRIFPLLWFASFFGIIRILITSPETFSWSTVFLNYTGLFGFVTPNAYLATGAWSIGHELVFYAFFPFLYFLLKRKNIIITAILVLAALSICGYVSYIVFPQLNQLGIIWKTYLNPLTQLIYFLSGMVMAQTLWKQEIKQSIVIVTLISTITLFLLIPVSERVDLIIGNNRLIFSILAILLCWCFFKLRIQLPTFIQKPLKYIGDISYSIYLIHPIFYWGIKVLFIQLQLPIPFHYLIPVSMIGTICMSHLVYTFIEKPMVKLGKAITQHLKLA